MTLHFNNIVGVVVDVVFVSEPYDRGNIIKLYFYSNDIFMKTKKTKFPLFHFKVNYIQKKNRKERERE